MMTKTQRIILTVLSAVILLYGLNVYIGWKNQLLIDKIETVYLDTVDDLTSKRTIYFETKGNITAIEIFVDGQVSANLILTIGYSDTTSYREYKLDSGKIDIEHKSDWYTEKCFITFTPTSPAKGKLEISCNFIGD